MTIQDLKSGLKDAVQSSNFWIALAFVVLGFFVRFDLLAAPAAGTVGAIVAVIAGAKTLYNLLKDKTGDWKEWVQNSNFWNYLGVIVTALIPAIDISVVESLESVVRSLLGGNWQAAVIAGISLFTILYNIIKRPGSDEPNPA